MPEKRDSIVPALPLYVGELLILLTGVGAVNVALEDPWFAHAATLASVVAVAVGLLVRISGLQREHLLYAVLGFGVLALVSPPVRAAVLGVLVPVTALTDMENMISTVMLWLAVASAAGAATNAATVFVAVPLTTAFAMVAQSNIGDRFFALLMVFALLGLFQVSYEHLLTEASQRTRPARAVGIRQATRVALLFSTLFCSIAFVAASIGARSALAVSQSTMRRAIQGMVSSSGQRSATQTFPGLVNYPQGQGLVLGEPLGPGSDTLVMTVVAEAPALWRGATYEQYTGSGWRTSLQQDFPARSYGGWTQVRQRPENIPARRVILEQQVRILDLRSNALFAASVPVRVRGEFGSLRVREDGTLATMGATWKGMRYEVESLVADATSDDLRAAGTEYPKWVTDTYLQIPNSAYEIEQLAQTVAGDAATPYDQLVAIQRFLEQDFVYTLRPPQAPEGQDRTAWFLTKSRKGYCDLFASGVVLMARSLSIPARLATGFSSGEPVSNNTYQVRARNAHAWAEVYFPDWGWIPFDPQAVRATGGGAAAATQTVGSIWRWLRVRIRFTPPLVVLVVTVLAAILMVFQPSLQAGAAAAARRLFGPPFTASERISRAYATAERRLARRGLGRAANQTPREHLATVASSGVVAEGVIDPLAEMAALVEKSAYARGYPSRAEAYRAEQVLRRVKAALRQARSGARRRTA